jgi:cell division protein FtsA
LTLTPSIIGSSSRGAASRRFIAEIIEVRLAEIFEFVNNDLKVISRSGQLPAGVVLTGGGAKLPGLTDLVIQELRLPARIGIPEVASYKLESENLSEVLEDPEYACALGLVSWGADKMLSGKRVSFNLFGWASNIVDYFMP